MEAPVTSTSSSTYNPNPNLIFNETSPRVIHLEKFKMGLKKAGQVALGALAFIVVAVAHPILGPIGSLGCLFSAAYHGLAMNYHWRHSREKDEQGKYIAGTALINQSLKDPYSNKNPGYTKKDLPRLEHEKQRLFHQRGAEESLKWARGLAKASIPIAGPFWAFLTEMDSGGSAPIGCDGCGDHFDHETLESRLAQHLNKLKEQG